MLVMQKIAVMGRSQIESMYEPFQAPTAVISIRGTHPSEKRVAFDIHKTTDVLYLQFDDVDRVKENALAFCYNDAEKVWDFVEKNWDTVESIVIHCVLGLSRSPGIAAAICKVKYGDDSIWFRQKVPNRRVYRAMLEVANKRGLLCH